jgi:hypothetical protein
MNSLFFINKISTALENQFPTTKKNGSAYYTRLVSNREVEFLIGTQLARFSESQRQLVIEEVLLY